MINFEKNQKRKGFQAECVRKEPCGAVPHLLAEVEILRQKDDLAPNCHREHDRSLVSRVFGVASPHSRIQAPKEKASCPVAEVDLRQDDAEVRDGVESAHGLCPDRGLELQSSNPHLHLYSVEQNEEDEEGCELQITSLPLFLGGGIVKPENQWFYRHLPCEGKPADELGKTFHFGLPFWVDGVWKCTTTTNIPYIGLQVKRNRKSPYFRAFSWFLYWIKKFSSPRMQNRQFIFEPKMQYSLTAERSEAAVSNLRIPFWCHRKESNLQLSLRTGLL